MLDKHFKKEKDELSKNRIQEIDKQLVSLKEEEGKISNSGPLGDNCSDCFFIYGIG